MTAINLEEELIIEENPWRGRVVTVIVLGAIIGLAAALLYYFVWRDESTATTRATEDIPVERKTISQTLSISGQADAELNSNLVFQSSGKVSTVNVKVGDQVQQDQVLATLESEDLQNAVDSARAQQAQAQLRLDDLLDGGTASEVAAAEQAYSQAQAALTKAQNDYDDLLDGVSDADIATAQQGVAAAESQLATARSTRDALADGATDAEIIAAEAAVTAAQSSLAAAEALAESADNGVASAEASLKAAETGLCALNPVPLPSFCGVRTAPVSGSDLSAVEAALNDASTATAASGVIAANNAFLGAQTTASNSDISVSAAQESLASAEARLDALNEGASAADIAAADAAVAAAEAGLASAQAKLATAQEGATPYQISTARSALDSAFAAVDAAQARREEVILGPEQNAIEQARQAVVAASLQVQAAEIRLEQAQIVAPFAGTVGAVNIRAGEFFSIASAEGAAIVLLTPDRMTMLMDVGETDYANIKLAQAGGVVFDSIPGQVYPFTISEIGLAPEENNGVTTYAVKATLIVRPEQPKPAPGMNARGQIITSSKPDVLSIPPRAIRRSGTDQVVTVKRDGQEQTQVVTTGVSDNNNVEIVSGLEEGDVVVVVTLTTASDGPEEEPTLPGGIR